MDAARREFAEKDRTLSAELRARDLKLRELQSSLRNCKDEKQRTEDEKGLLLEEVKRCGGRACLT